MRTNDGRTRRTQHEAGNLRINQQVTNPRELRTKKRTYSAGSDGRGTTAHRRDCWYRHHRFLLLLRTLRNPCTPLDDRATNSPTGREARGDSASASGCGAARSRCTSRSAIGTFTVPIAGTTRQSEKILPRVSHARTQKDEDEWTTRRENAPTSDNPAGTKKGKEKGLRPKKERGSNLNETKETTSETKERTPSRNEFWRGKNERERDKHVVRPCCRIEGKRETYQKTVYTDEGVCCCDVR